MHLPMSLKYCSEGVVGFLLLLGLGLSLALPSLTVGDK